MNATVSDPIMMERHVITAPETRAKIVYDDDLFVRDLNDETTAIFRLPKNHALGSRIHELVPDPDTDPLVAMVESVRRSGKTIHFEYEPSTLPGRWLAVTVSKTGSMVTCEFTDCTQARFSAHLLERRTAALKFAMDMAEDASHRASEKSRVLEIIARTGQMLSAELDLQRLLDQLTQASVDLSGAAFGAYFHTVFNEANEPVWEVRSLSGAPMEMFTRLGKPRITSVFKPTFFGDGVVRVNDILADPRYGSMGGMPQHHLPVRSYMAIPVVCRNGRPLGGLLLGHPLPDRFQDSHQDLLVGIAAQAAVAIDNAELVARLQTEIEERKAAEERQEWLLREFNHRIKNVLTVVQGIANQTIRNTASFESFQQAFSQRLTSLSSTHDLLVQGDWSGATMEDLLATALGPFRTGTGERFSFSGPQVHLTAKAVSALALALHELATNAVKYGALSNATGEVSISWWVSTDGRLRIVWKESGGPKVSRPKRLGFGSALVSRMLAQELDGTATIAYSAEGVSCTMDLSIF